MGSFDDAHGSVTRWIRELDDDDDDGQQYNDRYYLHQCRK